MGIKLTDKDEIKRFVDSEYFGEPVDRNHIGVWVIEEKDGKVKEKYVETDTLLGATRIMNSWKCGRGWEVVQFRVEEVGRLW
jgi:hypothetical protein